MDPSAGSAAVVIAATLLLLASFSVYGQLLRHVARSGGRVGADGFGQPELFVALVLTTLFVTLTYFGFTQDVDKPATQSDLLLGALQSAMMMGFVVALLWKRRISLSQLFGLHQISLAKAFGFGVVLLLAAFPLLIFAGAVARFGLGEDAEPQKLVDFFVEAARASDFRTVAATFAFGAILAPLTEEFIFRGFLYTVFKRTFGLPAALLITSLLFAAIHVDLTSFLPLFVLAICLTVGYEATGSLLVSVCMHCLFNVVNLLVLLTLTQGSK